MPVLLAAAMARALESTVTKPGSSTLQHDAKPTCARRASMDSSKLSACRHASVSSRHMRRKER